MVQDIRIRLPREVWSSRSNRFADGVEIRCASPWPRRTLAELEASTTCDSGRWHASPQHTRFARKALRGIEHGLDFLLKVNEGQSSGNKVAW